MIHCLTGTDLAGGDTSALLRTLDAQLPTHVKVVIVRHVAFFDVHHIWVLGICKRTNNNGDQDLRKQGWRVCYFLL